MRILIFFLLFCSAAHSATLKCKSFVNLKETASLVVTTELGRKISLVSSDEFASFLTENKPDYFSLEVFVPSLEARVYSESTLSNSGQTLTATIWDRDILISMTCDK